MLKREFLKRLDEKMRPLPKSEREDIMRDIEEHFYFGLQEGESEEAIVSQLGSPEKMGKELVAAYRMEQVAEHRTARHVFQAVWAVVGLSLFNLIIVLGPFLALLGLLIAGWTAGGSFIITPILYSGMSLIYPPKFIWFEWFLSLALAGLGILMCLGMYQMTKLTIHAFMRYLHWNYRMVKGGQTS
ncbi:MAG TPA: DUF1700 domain-containing protein [Pseudogracilibacillus sp.]|nr:DUF1700 domain-containing protein [Pseudogracilibacillus sp.]